MRDDHTIHHDRRVEPAAGACAPTCRLLAATLEQLADLVRRLSDAQYVQHPVGVIASSIGGHVRHCLDHFQALCAGAAVGVIDYDARERGTSVETSRPSALAAIDELAGRVASLGPLPLGHALQIRTIVASDGAAIVAPTSLGRELSFVLSHTIHHNALISAMCRTLAVDVPEHFGYAPSTLAHLDRPPCARSASFR